ncbi:MAG: class I SAM-dependent methyltransferase [Caldisericia bacterium]
MSIFEKMLADKRWLYRPWLPFLKAVEGDAFSRYELTPPVLDLACGDGTFAISTCDRKINVGLDLEIESLTRASGKYRSIIQADATRLPFKEKTFQMIISSCAVEHIPNLKYLLLEIYKALKPEGKFIFSVPSVHFGSMLLKTRLLKALGLEKQADEYVRDKNCRSVHIHLYELKEWETILASCNFKLLSHEYCLSNKVMLLWSFMTSFVFKLFFLPFRAVRDHDIKPLDNLLRVILDKLFERIIARESKKKLLSGGYLILVATRE